MRTENQRIDMIIILLPTFSTTIDVQEYLRIMLKYLYLIHRLPHYTN